MRTRTLSLLTALAMAAVLPGCAYITRATQAATGTQANGSSGLPSLSGNGRWVAFSSIADNLVSDDTNAVADVFVRDNVDHAVVRVSVKSDGSEATGFSGTPSISDDGRRIAFESQASNLDPGDTNGVTDIFLHDRDTDADGIFDEPGAIATILMSRVSGNHAVGNGPSVQAAIYGNGLGVVYESLATNLAPSDTNGVTDIFATDLFAGVFPVARLVSKPDVPGVPAANGASQAAAVNADGSVIAFATGATNLIRNDIADTNQAMDVVIWDVHFQQFDPQLPAMFRATGSVLAETHNFEPAVSHDAFGRYVTFTSHAMNLVPKTWGVSDIFLLDRSTNTLSVESRTSTGATGGGDSSSSSISADGARIGFVSHAGDLVPGDTNHDFDIFVRDRASSLTQRANTTLLLAQANQTSGGASISGDGRYVAFHSAATNLVTPDANGVHDVFVRAAVVPQIDSIVRLNTLQQLGDVTSRPSLKWGTNTIRITGKGFGPDVAVDFGGGVTVSGVTHTPTQIDLTATVANGTPAGTRNVIVDNIAFAGIGDRNATQVCFGCASVQRWVTAPDPAHPSDLVAVLSNGEFSTESVALPPYSSISGDADVLYISQFIVGFPLGTHDISVQPDYNLPDVLTCTGCLHVE